jgi:hypothetical protein
MTTASTDGSVLDRQIGVRLTPQSLAPRVQSALQNLGYVLHDAEPSETDFSIWLVDEDRLAGFPDTSSDPDSRIVLITAPHGANPMDARIVGRTPRPGRLNPIYAMLQVALEKTPRRDPRVRTRLAARCIRADRRSIGSIISLSEGGCAVRTAERLRKGSTLEVQFALPDFGMISSIAECRYVRRGDAGLAFSNPSREMRHSISHFVTSKLAAPRTDHGAPGPGPA